jgi:sensor histidine kinase regulating citrate/malate metabolism
VIDSGKGIPTNLLRVIGEKPVSQGKKAGMGYGLYDAFQTIKGSGGEISVISKVEQGTRVEIKIPVFSFEKIKQEDEALAH